MNFNDQRSPPRSVRVIPKSQGRGTISDSKHAGCLDCGRGSDRPLGVDTFAAAVGNLRGRYPVPKQLDLELLAEIRDAITVNISLHGGSGTLGHYFRSAAEIGVSKINLNSDLQHIDLYSSAGKALLA